MKLGKVLQPLLIAVLLPLSLGYVEVASAHTTSLGYVPGANPGEVTFWTGNYQNGTPVLNEGTGQLVGFSLVYDSGVLPFNIPVVTSKPTGLIDGTNNFFWSGSGPYVFGTGTDPNLFGGIVRWQGLTITGLNPGTYDFTIADDARTTFQWQNLSPGSVQIVLTGQNIGGGGTNGTVPEPATLALLGLGLMGLAATHRRKQTT